MDTCHPTNGRQFVYQDWQLENQWCFLFACQEDFWFYAQKQNYNCCINIYSPPLPLPATPWTNHPLVRVVGLRFRNMNMIWPSQCPISQRWQGLRSRPHVVQRWGQRLSIPGWTTSPPFWDLIWVGICQIRPTGCIVAEQAGALLHRVVPFSVHTPYMTSIYRLSEVLGLTSIEIYSPCCVLHTYIFWHMYV